MIDVGWSELMAIAVILIVVVGPKDLPAVLRGIGQVTRKVRGMADEFKKGVDEFIRESELKDIQNKVEKVKDFNLDRLKAETERTFNQTIDPMAQTEKKKPAVGETRSETQEPAAPATETGPSAVSEKKDA